MEKKVLFIHGAGNKQNHDGSGGLIAYLEDKLGNDYEVLSPDMPDPDNPRYEAWKTKIEKEIAALDDDVILIGHSVGGSVLLKCLSECPYQAVGLYLVAAPYRGRDEDWQITEYILPEGHLHILGTIKKSFQGQLPGRSMAISILSPMVCLN